MNSKYALLSLLISFGFIGVYLLGCGTPIVDTTGSGTITTDVTTQEISAATGGTVSFSDGSSVNFPANSFSSNTTVTVSKLTASQIPTQVLAALYVGPTIEGLAVPATVTLKYDPASVGADQEVLIGVVGGANTPEAVSSSEVSVAQIISPESIDETNGTVTVKVNHFSWVWAFCQDKSYLVFDFSEFMYGVIKPGDILFALTGAGGYRGSSYNGSWIPGHVGLYVGTAETGTFVPGLSDIMESTVSKVTTGKNGVQYSGSYNFKRLGHIFLGARRPKAYNLSDGDRSNILTQARKMLGWPYDIINFDNFGIPLASGVLAGPTVGITCVGFVEKAYEDAGLAPLVATIRQHLFFPIELFTKTKPVTDISVHVNEGVEFYVYGVVRNNYLTFSKWRTYLDSQQNYYNVSAASSTLNINTVTFPACDEAHVYAGGRTPTFVSEVAAGGMQYGHHEYPYFYWAPASTEAGHTHAVTFTLNAKSNGTKTETVNITVLP